MTESRYQRTYPISWDQLHRDAKALSWRLLDKDFFNGIIAVTRGGLVPAPAGHLAHRYRRGTLRIALGT